MTPQRKLLGRIEIALLLFLLVAAIASAVQPPRENSASLHNASAAWKKPVDRDAWRRELTHLAGD